MARKWWQYTGFYPDTGVEEWPAGSPPNACTVFRHEWLNQFLGWACYTRGEGFGDNYTYKPIVRGAVVQSASFWNQFIHLYNNASFLYGSISDIAENSELSKISIGEQTTLSTKPHLNIGDIIHPGADGDCLIQQLKYTRETLDSICGWMHPGNNGSFSDAYRLKITYQSGAYHCHPTQDPGDRFSDTVSYEDTNTATYDYNYYKPGSSYDVYFKQEGERADCNDPNHVDHPWYYYSPIYYWHNTYIKSMQFASTRPTISSSLYHSPRDCGYLRQYRLAFLTTKYSADSWNPWDSGWEEEDDPACFQAARNYSDHIDERAPSEFPAPAGIYCHKILPKFTSGTQIVNVGWPSTQPSINNLSCDFEEHFTLECQQYDRAWTSYYDAEWCRLFHLACLVEDRLPDDWRHGWPPGAAAIVDS